MGAFRETFRTGGRDEILFRDLSFETVNAYIALAAVGINFTFAVMVLMRTSRETIYTTFALICLSVAFWNFADFMVYTSGEPTWLPAGVSHATPWKYLGPAGSGPAVGFLFHFACALVKKGRRMIFWIILCYALAVIVGFSPAASFFHRGLRTFVDGVGWNLSFFIALFPFIMASIVMVLSALHRSSDAGERDYLRFISAALILQVLMGLTDLFQRLDLPLPPLGHLGSSIGPVILGIGISRHRKAFDVLAQTRMKMDLLSEMAAGITHEIRNPLTAIKGITRLKPEVFKSLDDEKIKEYQEIVNEEIFRIEDILTSFRDSTKPIVVGRDRVVINDVIRKIVKLINLQVLELKLELALADNLPEANADPSLLRQVFLNLVRNASEACGKGGCLNIETGFDDDWIWTRFTDNGPGIPGELMERIFDPFFSTKEGGMGMGLPIIKRIVDAHQGRITIEGASPSGTRVTVLIPRV